MCMKNFLFFIALSLAHLSLHAQYKNLVFEGGGVRGIAFIGAVEVIEQNGILSNIEKVAGTSAGSIVAMMVSLGYSAEEMKSIMLNMKVQHFNDGKGGLVGKYARTKKYYGIYKGDVFEAWIGKLVQAKTGNATTTFRQLDSLIKSNNHYKSFYCMGTNLTKQRAEIFSFQHTPDLEIKQAVRISCAIPFFYEPVLLDSAGKVVNEPKEGYVYNVMVDGGVLANYPIGIFDSCKSKTDVNACDSMAYNPQTIGFKLERDEQIGVPDSIAPYPIHNLNDFTQAFFNMVIENLNRKPYAAKEEGRTVYISYNNISPKPRKITSAEKLTLYQNGVKATKKFLDKEK